MAQDHPLPAPETLLEHAQWVSRLARDLVRDHQAAEDVVQETWLAFLRLRPDRNRPVRPWLARVVRNQAALLRRRGRGREAREAEVARPEAILSAEEVVERGEVQRRLVGAVLELDEPYRSTLLLRYYEGLAPREIAELRGLNPATVRTHLSRGHARLKDVLDAQHGGDRERWMGALAPLLPLVRPRGLGRGVLAAAGVAVVAGAAALSLGSDAPGTGPGERARPDTAEARIASVAPRAPERAFGGRTEAADPEAGAKRNTVVVDAATGRPLPHLRVAWAGRTSTTDRNGALDLPHGAATVTVGPDPGAATWVVERHGARTRRDEGAAELTPGAAGTERIPWATGPTVRVRFVGPLRPDPGSLSARLGPVNTGPYGDHGRPIHGAALRTEPVDAPEGHDAWVRFGPAAASLATGGGPLLLEVLDAEGLARGAVRIGAPLLAGDEPVDVEMLPTARLDLATLLGPGAAAEAVEGAIFGLQEPDGRVTARVELGADGTGRLGWIAPGTYRLVLDAPRVRADASTLTLDAGERAWREVELAAVELGGPVAGRVVAAVPSFDEQLLVFLRDGSGEVHGVAPTTWRTVDGARVAPFAFQEAPAGPLRLDVVSLGSAVTARAEPADLQAPCTTVVVRLTDGVPAADLEVRAIDGTGAELASFRFEVSLDGGPLRHFDRGPGEDGVPRWTLVLGGMRWNDFDGPAPLRRLPEGTALRWTLRAPGRAPVSGTDADVERTPDGRRVLTVELGARAGSSDSAAQAPR